MPNDHLTRPMHSSLRRSAVAAIALQFVAVTLVEGRGAARRLWMGGRSPLYAPQGVAARSQPLATEAALAVMQRGGNAIDAAVTAAAVLSVVEPMMTGVGGDLFALIWSAK